MSSAVARAEVPPAADPRLTAFLSPGCPEVFHSVATPTEIWQADPYDVETIHAEAREALDHVLYRGGRTPPPPSGVVLVLLGEAGSGKTHLMRAFRTRAHGQGLGYCGYLQMTTEASNYARYMLTNLIDGLEQPYAPDGPSRTGLARLSAALLESVPELTAAGREAFREGEGDPTRLVDNYADRLQGTGRFRDCDLELVRVMLNLERNEPRVRSRALMWLRCQEMRPQDREWIGGAVARTDDSDPTRGEEQTGHNTVGATVSAGGAGSLISTVGGASLVGCSSSGPGNASRASPFSTGWASGGEASVSSQVGKNSSVSEFSPGFIGSTVPFGR